MRQRVSTVTGLFCFKTRVFFKLKILFNLISTGKDTSLAKNCSNFKLKERKLSLSKENRPLFPLGTACNFRLDFNGSRFDNKARLNELFLCRAAAFKATRATTFLVVGLEGTNRRRLEFVRRFISL
jgi:hypothetical protein